MTSADASFQSITGALESAEPGAHEDATSQMPATSATRKGRPPSNAGPDSVAALSARPTAQRALNVSSVSASPSPNSSRDASPAGHHPRTNPSAAAGTVNHRTALRSRKSSTEASPSRGPSPGAAAAAAATNPPSAAAIQRALSATNIPQPSATATTTDSTKATQSSKPNSGPNSGDSTPRWPISPRLRSPPPEGRSSSRSRANSIRAQIKKPESQSTPAIVVQSSSPASVSRIPVREEALSDQDEPALSMKTLTRGVSGNAPKLETVQETSQPATPGIDSSEADSFVSIATAHKPSDEERNDVSSAKATEDLSSSKHNAKQNGSGSDTTTKKTQTTKMQEHPRSASAQRPHHVTTKPSLSSLSTRSATQPSRNMTVETETVPSVAQSAIGNTDRSSSSRVDGSLRLKPSNETIRPKKERKAPKRKAPSINAGTASTKADVFEQHVANEVNDADSSDSEATFIYDSNQPEQQPHRSRHHHSRTPSMTSIASLADPRLAIRDSHKNPGKKNSMKFTNQYNNPNLDADADRSDGTIRLGSGRVGGGSHHHHIGRHGQGRGTLSHLNMDSDSSKAQSSRMRGPSSRQTSQPNSPRYHTFGPANGLTNGDHANGSSKFAEYSTYDMDMEHVADDERTPLVPTRSPRVRTPRRRNSVTLRFERRPRHSNGLFRRFAGCLVLSILILVVMFCFLGLIIASTKPLMDVRVQSVQNVVASQEELMLDLVVDAINPNIIGVTVSDMDLSIFANSKHVGSDKWWRHHGSRSHDDKEQWRPVDDPTFELEDDLAPNGIDEGTDPIEGEPRTMSLGRLFHFDSPLNYEGSWWSRRNASSIGEIRLLNPGNKTEAGGTERWIEVLQYPFEIIVRGTIKYQLPLSNTMHSDAITAKYCYDPDTEKKKLRVIERSRNDSLHSTTTTTKPSGRYDRRALQLLAFH